MICTFCGGENRAENRFCGMCGVRIERRNKERRTNAAGSAKCPSCGHQNEPGYKFCGLCGTRIERRIQDRRGTSAEARANALANAQLPTPELANRRTATLVSEPEIPPSPESAEKTPVRRSPQPGSIFVTQEKITHSTSIGGPSFLGLNSEPQSEGEYLLDDESSSRGGLRTLVLLAILAAILGLIFVQWRSSYRANPKSSPATPPAQSQPQGNSHPGAPAAPAASNPSPSQAAAQPLPKQPDNKAAAPPEIASSNDTAASAKSDPADDQEDEDTGDAKQAANENSKALPPEKTKPSAALIRAQKYLQGRGVPQSCEQGLMYLKAATEENDPRAAVQMGALYSSGHCVQQDRVKAYKWFSTARDLEPQNQWLEKNLNQLWAQMTPEERRRIQ